ncbi:MAG TPA: hypothetical protein VMU28_13405 [Terriglobales bacterium]|nr:hypothetical protein [Terriglobales bacterium]
MLKLELTVHNEKESDGSVRYCYIDQDGFTFLRMTLLGCWYHPHIHGFSKLEVLGGTSGALIVEGIEGDAHWCNLMSWLMMAHNPAPTFSHK